MAFNMTPMRVPHVPRLRLPMRLPPGVKGLGAQVVAGIFAIASGSVAAVPLVDHFDIISNYARVASVISVAAAVIGGVLTIVRFAFGPPLAVGGVALFIGAAVPVAISRIDSPTAFSTTDVKLVLAAGAAGLVAFVLCAALLVGRAMSGVGGIVAVLALVAVASIAALVHVDDSHHWQQVGAILGSLLVAIVIITGAAKGRWGSIAAVVAAGAQAPGWLDLALHNNDRKAASVAGLIATIGIIGLAAIAAILAATGAADGAFGRGPDHAIVGPVVRPMVRPYAVPTDLEPRVGPVLMPVSVMIPEVAPPNSDRRAAEHQAAVATMTAAPAQWSADPYRHHEMRYYDGSRWTEHVSDLGVASLDPVD
ncbi:MAG: DUF2510 domain-containing protein [Ilumatobacteraceae bacterium]